MTNRSGASTGPGRIGLAAAVVVYLSLLLASVWLLSLDTLTQAYAKYTVALLPIGPAVAIVILAVRRYQRLDELAQRIHLMALSVAFVGTVLFEFTWGLLEFFFLEFGDRRRLGGFATFGILVGLYLVGLLWARRRYQ